MNIFQEGYLIGTNRETGLIEEVSTRVRRFAAEEFVRAEAELNEVVPGGLHQTHKEISFVNEENMKEGRELIARVNKLRASHMNFRMIIIKYESCQ